MNTNGSYQYDVIYDGRNYVAYRNGLVSKTRQCAGVWLNTAGKQVSDQQTIVLLESACPGACAEYSRQRQHARKNKAIVSRQRMAFHNDRQGRRGRGQGNRYE